ncbi:hypothetical protein ABT095_09620 [Kitasatospora sp. NPDC002227]|uniref:hypothetical protein n=1 Tax=Kitasatospora sp. NPDC002227 TaxID=3154773 RepID=UPI0033305FC7
MGASGWTYVTPYQGSVEATLNALHEEEFEREYAQDYDSLAELWADEEFMGEQGTHSILDITRVVRTTEPPEAFGSDFSTLRPVPLERVRHHLGTDRPTVEQFRAAEARYEEKLRLPFTDRRAAEPTLFDEPHIRWTGLYVLLHTDGLPTHVGIFGYSGD